MKYNVHMYAVVRVRVNDVEADSPVEAIRKAEDSVNWYDRFDRVDQEFAEEFAYHLVDVVGDEEYEQSQWFKWENGEYVADKLQGSAVTPAE
jgi:hypothetical protein